MSEKRSKQFLYFSVGSVNLLTFSVGIANSWTSPVIPKLYSNDTGINPLPEPITTSDESWIAALLNLGAVFGPLAAGICADKYGRKNTLLLFALLMIVGNLLAAFATSVGFYYAARFIIGVGCGSVYVIVPLYVAEVSEKENRGLLGCVMGVMLPVGNFVAYSVGPYVSVQIFSLICLIPTVSSIFLFGLLGPESPHYLVLVNKNDCAEKSLVRLRNQSAAAVEKELSDIIRDIKISQNNKGGFSSIFASRSASKSLLISCALIMFLQMSGNYVFLAFMQSIFDASGSDIPADIATLAVGGIQVIVCALTSLLIDKLGRKILLLVSLAGCCISIVTLGTYFYLQDNDFNVKSIFWLPIVCVVAYFVTFSVGLGPITYAIMGEIFPTHVKSLASTITICIGLFTAFIITMFFPSLSVIIGMAASFWIFAVFCALGFLFVILVVPETKGKSFEEIQNILSR